MTTFESRSNQQLCMPNCVNKVKNDITDDTCRRCAEINVIKTKKLDTDKNN